MQKGFTQKYVASRINITVSALSQYETGKRIPKNETLSALVHLYGTTSDYLLGITSEEPSNNKQEECPTQAQLTVEKNKLLLHLDSLGTRQQYKIFSALNQIIQTISPEGDYKEDVHMDGKEYRAKHKAFYEKLVKEDPKVKEIVDHYGVAYQGEIFEAPDGSSQHQEGDGHE